MNRPTPRCTQPPEGRAARAAAAYAAPIPVLKTARLTLRAPRLQDLDAWTQIYLEAFADTDAGEGPEEAWEEFSYYTAGWLLHGHGLWSVDRTVDRALVGFVHLGLEWDDDEPEVGWMFLPEHRGQGYATEAAMAARDWGGDLLPTFVSYIDPTNLASQAVAARLGASRDAETEARIAAAHGTETQVWRHGARP
ncbi:MAG: GNAT family N-acetyltransferase [Pseudomonadota bacterium]